MWGSSQIKRISLNGWNEHLNKITKHTLWKTVDFFPQKKKDQSAAFKLYVLCHFIKILYLHENTINTIQDWKLTDRIVFTIQISSIKFLCKGSKKKIVISAREKKKNPSNEEGKQKETTSNHKMAWVR